MKIENRNLKKNNEELKEEIKSLKNKAHDIDLLADADRTISENLDLKKNIQSFENQITLLKEENLKNLQQITHMKESNSVISQLNFSLEERFKQEKQNIEQKYFSNIKELTNENKVLLGKLERKNKELKEIQEQFKNYHKSDEDFNNLLHSHNEFSVLMEKFAKNHHKNYNF